MTKQVNIRSEKAHELAVKLSKRHGKSITTIIEEALEARDRQELLQLEERRARYQAAFKRAQDAVAKQGVVFNLEDMYDESGLPI